MSDALPPWAAGWLTALGVGLPAPEGRATCGDCVLCKAPTPPAHRFAPESKCCTYAPRLPNFLMGRILADPDPALDAGRAVLRQRLRRGLGVHPYGLEISDAERLDYDLLVEAGLFGQSAELRCPYYQPESGHCGIWRHRNATCATWYCRHDAGARGHRSWKAVEALLKHVEASLERALARWVIHGRHPKDPEAADAALHRGRFEAWIDDLEGYYQACGARLAQVDVQYLQAIDPEGLSSKLAAVEAAAQALAAPPPQGPLRFTGHHTTVDGTHRLWGYLRFAALSVPPAVAATVTGFTGHPAALRAALSAALGPAGAALADQLIADEVLGPADQTG